MKLVSTPEYQSTGIQTLCDSGSLTPKTKVLTFSTFSLVSLIFSVTEGSVLCPELMAPVRGQVESNGITATYSCLENISLVGDRERRCDTDSGQWLGEAPACSAGRISCVLINYCC